MEKKKVLYSTLGISLHEIDHEMKNINKKESVSANAVASVNGLPAKPWKFCVDLNAINFLSSVLIDIIFAHNDHETKAIFFQVGF